jgi:TetR/AcrR family transcriptional regulator
MERPPEEVLPVLARAYLGTLDHPFAPRLVRLLIGEGLRRPELGALFIERGPDRVLAFLKAYLSRQVQLRRLRPHDTRASARAFIGMLIPQIAAGVAFPTLGADGLTNEEHLRESVAIFLRGLAPEGGPLLTADDRQDAPPEASGPRAEPPTDG